MLNIKEYAWDIWQMAKAEHEGPNPSGLGVDVGLDLFLGNVRQGRGIAPGADLDWAALREAWEAMPAEEQEGALYAYHEATSALYGRETRLAKAFAAGDREGFEAIVAEPIPEPEEDF